MDAISFVLGVRTAQLRGSLKELLYHNSAGQSAEDRWVPPPGCRAGAGWLAQGAGGAVALRMLLAAERGRARLLAGEAGGRRCCRPPAAALHPPLRPLPTALPPAPPCAPQAAQGQREAGV